MYRFKNWYYLKPTQTGFVVEKRMSRGKRPGGYDSLHEALEQAHKLNTTAGKVTQ